MKVSEGFNEARGYGQEISVLTHEVEGIKHAINLIFPYKLRRNVEEEIIRLYAEQTGVDPKEIRILDLQVKDIDSELYVTLPTGEEKVALICYTYYRKKLTFRKELQYYYLAKGAL